MLTSAGSIVGCCSGRPFIPPTPLAHNPNALETGGVKKSQVRHAQTCKLRHVHYARVPTYLPRLRLRKKKTIINACNRIRVPPSAQSRICHQVKLCPSSWFITVLVVINAVVTILLLVLVLIVVVVGILLQWSGKLRYAPFVKACLDIGLGLKQRNMIWPSCTDKQFLAVY